MQGSDRVKHGSNYLGMPYGHQIWLKTLDQNVMHRWGQRSCRGHLGLTRGQITYTAHNSQGQLSHFVLGEIVFFMNFKNPHEDLIKDFAHSTCSIPVA